MAIIEADGLTKYYGETRGVEKLRFSVQEGEVFGLLGPDGAGKTTTVRTLMGLQVPTRGRATVLDYNTLDRRDRRAMKRDVGYLPSDPSFDEKVTGRQLLTHHASLKSEERMDELLELFALPLDQVIGKYSREDVQALAIVLAFMHDPDLVIMDEPTTGMDHLLRERFYGFLHTERERGTTIFLASNILNNVCKICDRVAIIRNGHLVGLEDTETLLDRGGKSVRVELSNPVDVDDFEFDGVHAIEIAQETEAVYSMNDDEDQFPADKARSDGHEDRQFVSQESENVDGSAVGQIIRPRTTVQFTYTGEYDALFEQFRDYTVTDLNIVEEPLEEIFTRCYGKRLGAVEDGGSDV
ncbi:ABC transporter ATP-binding protein [Halocatena marina]|uniref:ABC transporter ATP-binding protein n=1 Tax=Halocatena marina TaxID=2934937 RepID=UPI00200BF1FD|nr:ABC transporter ATP-binding protein [Halocatena marina]